MIETQIVENFLTNEEVDYINSVLTLEVMQSLGRTVQRDSSTYYLVTDEITDLLLSKIEKLPNEQLFIRVLDCYDPAGSHSDTSPGEASGDQYQPTRFARTLIIPMGDYDSNTILFDQNLPLGENALKYIETLPSLSPPKIDQETYDKYLTHLPHYHKDKLSIDTIFPWKKGSLLIFDRNRLHCSDNFLARGLISKRGFVIWTEV